MSPLLSYAKCHLVALFEKISLLDAYLGIQKREFLGGITFILAAQYPHFSSFALYSPCKPSQEVPSLACQSLRISFS